MSTLSPITDNPALTLAEQTLIGAAALDPPLCFATELEARDFLHAAAAKLWAGMRRLRGTWRGVADLAARVGTTELECSKLGEYLERSVRHACASFDVPHFADTIRQASITRQALLVAEHGRALVDQGADVERVLNGMQAELGALMGRTGRLRSRTALDLVTEALQLIEHGDPEGAPSRYVPVGLRTIDDICGGWQGGVVSVVGAPTSHGKSSLLLQTALHNAEAGRAVHLLSAEDLESDTTWRILARYTGVDAAKLRQYAQLDHHDRKAMAAAVPRLAPLGRLRMTSIAGRSAIQVVGLVRMHQSGDHTALVLVDYLQRLDVGAKRRYEAFTEAMDTFDRAAKQDGLPWVVASQLKRPEAGRSNPRPALADLRDSGAIEEVAKLVLGVFRPGKGGKSDDRIWVGVLKSSNGCLGSDEFAWDGPRMRIGEPMPYEFEPPTPRGRA